MALLGRRLVYVFLLSLIPYGQLMFYEKEVADGRPQNIPLPPGPPPRLRHLDSKPSTFVDPETMRSYAIREPKILVTNGELRSMWLLVKGAEVRVDFAPTGDQLWDRNMIHVVKSSANSSLRIAPYDRRCHYTSTTPHTFAAVSNCDGFLIGTVIVKDEFFILEPSSSRRSQNASSDNVGAEVAPSGLILRPARFRDFRQSKSAYFNTSHSVAKRQTDELSKVSFCGSAVVNRTDPNSAEGDQAEAVLSSGSYDTWPDPLIELAVFADRALWRQYEQLYGYWAERQLDDFLATLLNNVQLLYRHDSITPKVRFKVVRKEILKTQPPELPEIADAQTYLNYFCAYQEIRGSRNWDHAILFTGLDLVRNGGDRSISGMARVDGVCHERNACLVAEARDFTAAFITTHEIGHSLGMVHDEPYCPSSFIMSQSLGAGKVVWSRCSVAYFHKFLHRLESQGKNCMKWTQERRMAIEIGDHLPGQKYNAHQQCALMFGRGYRETRLHHASDRGICYMIWCRHGNGRFVTSHPALEGTSCDREKYCINGKCVPFARSLQTVHGGWSPWSAPDCVRCSCPAVVGGLSVARSIRRCDNPSPGSGGLHCAGDGMRGLICHASCDQTPSPSVQHYVDAICTGRRAARPRLGLTGSGLKMSVASDKLCKVFCEVETWSDRKNYRFLGDILPDGAQCDAGRYCLDGKCVPLICGGTVLADDAATCISGTNACAAEDSGAVWTAWTIWSTCSVTCGAGTKTRARTCVTPGVGPRPTNGCAGVDYERAICSIGDCSAARRISWNTRTTSFSDQWSEWSVCSVTCGSGLRIRHRSCPTGTCSQEEPCVKQPCVKWGGWGAWSACGRDKRKRRVRNCYGFGPKTCPGSDTDELVC